MSPIRFIIMFSKGTLGCLLQLFFVYNHLCSERRTDPVHCSLPVYRGRDHDVTRTNYNVSDCSTTYMQLKHKPHMAAALKHFFGHWFKFNTYTCTITWSLSSVRGLCSHLCRTLNPINFESYKWSSFFVLWYTSSCCLK